LDQRGEPEQESIGALFTRLIDDSRALITAELALFRLDFFQRVGRARLGIVLCLIGAMIGQAAAVVLLMAITYGLTPLIGGFGGAAVAALIGAATALLLLRIGARRLMLIVDDNPSDEKTSTATMDDLFERARIRSHDARTELAEAVGDAQMRLNPQTLLLQLWDEVLDIGQGLAHDAVDGIARRPVRIAMIAFAAALIVIRPPIAHLLERLTGRLRATGTDRDSLKSKSAGRPAHPPSAEEKTS
jgi:hypothetical protein